MNTASTATPEPLSVDRLAAELEKFKPAEPIPVGIICSQAMRKQLTRQLRGARSPGDNPASLLDGYAGVQIVADRKMAWDAKAEFYKRCEEIRGYE